MSDTAPIDIGHGMTAALRLSERFPDLVDGVPVGVLLTHACKLRNGEVVQDFIPIYHAASGADPWTLLSRDPISLTPSVSYTCCGLHGFVMDGKWVPA